MVSIRMLMNNQHLDFLKKDFIKGFPSYCDFTVTHAASGIFETKVKAKAEHQQQDGFVHAGVIATIADHTAGYAAYTVVTENFRILTIEFKINYFKPAIGDSIICKSKIINRGNKIIVAESEVFSLTEEKEKLVSKATVTLMAVAE